jgi:prepilin-type processing-associated H-X9-DG protein
MWLSAWFGGRADRLSNVGPPATLVAFADGPGNYCSVLPSTQSYSPVPRHSGNVNLVFLDGHAASFEGKLAGCGVGLPQRGDMRWRVPGSAWPGPP